MKKIGEIKGVPVVEGDANLVKNQILYKETDKGISLSKRTNGKLEEVSGGSSNNSNFEYWYIKYSESNIESGISVPTHFIRGIAKYVKSGVVKLKKCGIWPPLNTYNSSMYAMEVVPTQINWEENGNVYIIDATNYDSYLCSFIKILTDSLPDDTPEEELQILINSIKEELIEISKEEFEELYNSVEY